MSAEYIMASGNEKVILCERGIRTFETFTRNTLDLAAVPMLHELSPPAGHRRPQPRHGHQPARVRRWRWPPAAGGADGLIIEVHNDPIHALCDGAQSLTPGAV